MIVECPECSTQFNLPADRVTTRGSKVRCSKCSKTFRVRLSADGNAEVFQKSEGVADPPTQDVADLFDESFAEELDFAMQSTQFSAPGGGTQEVDPRRTMIGLPASNRDEPRSKSAAPDYNPFPFAALDEPKSHTPMPKRASSPTPMPQRKTAPTPTGIDLFDGEDPSLATSTSTVMLDDPFSEIFDEPQAPVAPAAASNEMLSPSLPKLGRTAPQAVAPAPRPEPTLKKPLVSALPVDDVPNEAEILGNQASDFGPAEDLVDPSFGQDTYFDPDAGRPVVAAPPAAAAPPRAAAAARPAPAPKPAAKAAPQARPLAIDDELDLAPHRIGGGGFRSS
ncbi:MAG: zinc-ribbon domain-containing protein [bacterium]